MLLTHRLVTNSLAAIVLLRKALTIIGWSRETEEQKVAQAEFLRASFGFALNYMFELYVFT